MGWRAKVRKRDYIFIFLVVYLKGRVFSFFSVKMTMTHTLKTSYNSAVKAIVLMFIRTSHEQQCNDF